MRKFLAFVLALFLYAYSAHLLAAADPVKQFGPLPKGWVYTGFGADFGVARGSTFNAAVARDANILWESAVSPKNGINFKTSNALRVGVTDVAVKTAANISAARVFAGFRGVLGGPLGVGLLLLPPVIDYLNQHNVRPGPNGVGFEMVDSSSCTVGPCFEYNGYGKMPYVSDQWYSSMAPLCAVFKAAYEARNPLFKVVITSCVSGQNAAVYFTTQQISPPTSPVADFYGVHRRSRGTDPDNWLPASLDDIAPYMGVGNATPALMEALLARGGEFHTETTSTTGPAMANQGKAKLNTVILPLPSTVVEKTYPGAPAWIGPGRIGNGYRDVRVEGVPQFEGGRMSDSMIGTVVPIPTTTDRVMAYDGPSDSTKVTDTTRYPGASVEATVDVKTDMTYSQPGGESTVGGKTKSTTTIEVKDENGNTISKNTTTNENVKTNPDPKEDVQFSDKELPEIPALYVRKYPDGMTGIWDEKILQVKATPLLSLVSGLMPDISLAGACPSWPLALDFATWANFGTRDVAPPCWVWDFGKFIITISALLLARALIFGG